MAKKIGRYDGLTMGDLGCLIEVQNDNSAAIANAIDQALVKGLTQCGLLGEGYAKMACPVDTGRLRNSITYQIDEGEKAVYIGTNVEYGPYVELGTRHSKAKPFLRPAAEDHAAQYRKALQSALQNG